MWSNQQQKRARHSTFHWAISFPMGSPSWYPENLLFTSGTDHMPSFKKINQLMRICCYGQKKCYSKWKISARVPKWTSMAAHLQISFTIMQTTNRLFGERYGWYKTSSRLLGQRICNTYCTGTYVAKMESPHLFLYLLALWKPRTRCLSDTFSLGCFLGQLVEARFHDHFVRTER